jgi:hypothetical protein
MEWTLAINDYKLSYFSALFLPRRSEILNFAFVPSMTLSNLNMSRPKNIYIYIRRLQSANGPTMPNSI